MKYVFVIVVLFALGIMPTFAQDDVNVAKPIVSIKELKQEEKKLEQMKKKAHKAGGKMRANDKKRIEKLEQRVERGKRKFSKLKDENK